MGAYLRVSFFEGTVGWQLENLRLTNCCRGSRIASQFTVSSCVTPKTHITFQIYVYLKLQVKQCWSQANCMSNEILFYIVGQLA